MVPDMAKKVNKKQRILKNSALNLFHYPCIVFISLVLKWYQAKSTHTHRRTGAQTLYDYCLNINTKFMFIIVYILNVYCIIFITFWCCNTKSHLTLREKVLLFISFKVSIAANSSTKMHLEKCLFVVGFISLSSWS